MASGRRGRPPGSSHRRAAPGQGTLAFGRTRKITKPSSLPAPSAHNKTSHAPPPGNRVRDVGPVPLRHARGEGVEGDQAVQGDEAFEEGKGTATEEVVDPLAEKAKRVPEAAVQ
ncbi:MAG: hypothetical protein Q9211_004848, partial [Gyalolechia sp. 1 TL-2023]